MMEVTAKTRFNSSKQRIESFGGNRYMVYLTFAEDGDSINTIKAMLSRYLGVPEKRITLKNRNAVSGDFVFSVD